MDEKDQEQQPEGNSDAEATEVTITPTSEQPSQEKEEEQAKQSVHTHRDFIASLSRTLSEEVRFNKLRATPNGLFVSQDMIPELTELFCEWKKDTANEALLLDKAKKRLFGEKDVELSYLLDGKATLVGALIAGPLAPSKDIQIPFFQGSLIAAKDYLHMRDPIFDSDSDVTAQLGSGGFTIQFRSKNGDLFLSQEMLKTFHSTIRHSPYLTKKYPEATQALRNCIPFLAKVWRESRAQGDGYHLLVPPGYRKEKHSTVFTWSELILIRTDKNELGFCYGTKGKNFRYFLTSELKKLERKRRDVHIKDFQLSTQRGVFGTLEVRKDMLKITENAFRDFIDIVRSSREFAKELPLRFTVKDILQRLTALLAESRWVEAHTLPKHLLLPGSKSYRSNKDWLFIFGRNFSLESFSHPAIKRKKPHYSGSRNGPRNKGARSDIKTER